MTGSKLQSHLETEKAKEELPYHHRNVNLGRQRPMSNKERTMSKTDNTPKMLPFEEATDEPLQDLKEEKEDSVGPYMTDILNEVYTELEAMVSAVLEKGIDLEKFEKWKDGCDMTKREYVEMEHKLISEWDLEEMFDDHADAVLGQAEADRAMDETYDSMIRQWNAGTF